MNPNSKIITLMNKPPIPDGDDIECEEQWCNECGSGVPHLRTVVFTPIGDVHSSWFCLSCFHRYTFYKFRDKRTFPMESDQISEQSLFQGMTEAMSLLELDENEIKRAALLNFLSNIYTTKN